MSVLRRSTRLRDAEDKKDKRMANHLDDRHIVELKVNKRMAADDQISEFKVAKQTAGQLINDQIAKFNQGIAYDLFGKYGHGVAGLYPQVITVQAGEDLATKVMSFSGNGWAVCILSANGAVSNVTLRHAASSRETVIYEGCFEILSLSGWYLPSESNGLNSRTGGINISLAGPNGRISGGGVAGPLTAASPIQVVIGSFLADNKKERKQAMNNGIPGTGSSPSRGALSGSSGGPGTPPNQNAAGSFNTSSHPVLSNFPWK